MVPTALFTGGNDWLADPTDVNASIPLLNTTGTHTHTHTHPHTSHPHISHTHTLTYHTPSHTHPHISHTLTAGHVFSRKHIPKYDHLDFIWGLDAATLVYKDIMLFAKNMLKP